MPYITQEKRKQWILPEKIGSTFEPGELAYLIYYSIMLYLKFKGSSFETFSHILGALEACKLEFHDRKMRIYELEKRIENGDVK